MPVGVKQVGAGEKSSENSVESEGCSPELFNRERLKRTRQLSKRTFGITNLTFSWRRRIPISRCSQFLVPITQFSLPQLTAAVNDALSSQFSAFIVSVVGLLMMNYPLSARGLTDVSVLVNIIESLN